MGVESQEVLEIARAWLMAGPGWASQPFLAGPLLEYQQLYDLENAPRVVDSQTVVRTLEIQALQAQSCVCRCDAETVWEYEDNAGNRSVQTTRIQGPLTLARTRDGWKVVDFVTRGRRALECIRLYEETQQIVVDGIRVRTLAVDLAGSDMVMFFEIENRGTAEVSIEAVTRPVRAGLSRRPRLSVALLLGVTVLAPGAREKVFGFWPESLSLATREVKLNIRVRRAGESRPIDIPLRLPFWAEQ